MRVKELIEELEKCDPDALVVANGQTSWFVEQLPWYYDGCCINDKCMRRHPKGEYDKLTYYTDGPKVKIHTFDIETWFEFYCLEKVAGILCVPKFSEVLKKFDDSHYYVQRHKDRYRKYLLDVWFEWYIALKEM